MPTALKKEEIQCPLGSVCIGHDDKGDPFKCAWYTHVEGANPNTGEEINSSSCAISWIPILLIETANTNRGQTAALESFRNETVKGQKEFNKLVSKKLTKKEGLSPVNNTLGGIIE